MQVKGKENWGKKCKVFVQLYPESSFGFSIFEPLIISSEPIEEIINWKNDEAAFMKKLSLRLGGRYVAKRKQL